MWFWTLGHSQEVQLQANSWRNCSPLGCISLEPRHGAAGVRAAPTLSHPWNPGWLNENLENKGVEAEDKWNVIRTRIYIVKGEPSPTSPELLRQLSSEQMTISRYPSWAFTAVSACLPAVICVYRVSCSCMGEMVLLHSGYTKSSCVLAVLLLVPATLEKTQRSVPEKGRKEGQLNQTDCRRKAPL